MRLRTRAVRLFAALAAAGMLDVVACAVALAQDDPSAKPKPPQVDPMQAPVDWMQVATDIVHKPGVQVVLGVIVVLTIIRIVYGIKEGAKRAARTGGQGMLGKFYAKKELEHLIQQRRFDEA